MRVHVIAVGRARSGPTADLFEHYAGRIATQATGPLRLREVEARRGLSGDGLKQAEADALRAALPTGATIVALDERGQDLGSADFADRLGRWRDGGVRDVAFLIGGADGLAEDVRRAADLVVRFGRATWPHQMVRAMLAEQIYRAQTILAGHPYHRS